MIVISGYTITKLLYDKGDSLIYHGYRESDKKNVVIKVLKEEKPSIVSLAKLHHEFKILERLHGDGTLPVIELKEQDNRLSIIHEDFGTSSLKEYIWREKLSLMEMLTYALKITEALEKIHSHNIIHARLNPDNVLCDINSQEIKITNFSFASTLSRLHEVINVLEVFESKDLCYISPEQTGRVNKKIDYRTDYYSLGVIFYEMATGILPIHGYDWSEVLNNIVVQVPTPVDELDPYVPSTVSNIIMKLLAKNPEDRYQTIKGVKEDLAQCLLQLRKNQTINYFDIASKDIRSSFQISDKIYGQEEALKDLFTAFDIASQGNAGLVLLMTDQPGTGKMTFVNRLYQPLIEKNGYLISGNVEQFSRNIPYAPLINAFEKLIQQILRESELQIKSWRNRLQEALGSNGQVILEVIPILASLIGEQPPVPVLGPTETENRFNLVFQKFMRTLASSNHPLIIFLDNTQWTDLPTIKMLEKFLLHSDSKYTLVIASYNVSEATKGDLMKSVLDNLKKSGFVFTSIKLQSLLLEHVTKLIADTLQQDEANVLPLAKLCYAKTKGNPFFLKHFFRGLYRKGFIWFDSKNEIWSWDLNVIKKQDYSTSILNFLVNEISELSKSAINTLQIASMFGNQFDLHSVAMLSERSKGQIMKDMWEAMHKEFIIPTDSPNLYDYIPNDPAFTLGFSFANDSVQKAVYSMIEEQQLELLHLKIGRLLLKTLPENMLLSSLLSVVRHLNFGIDLITVDSEREKVAKLNLMAGIKAKQSVAHKEAMKYLKRGLDFLSEDSWQKDYNLTLSLYTEITEVAYLSADFTEMEKYGEITLANARNMIDKAKIIEIKILYYTEHNMLEAVFKTGISFLKSLGIKIPPHVTTLHLFWSWLTTQVSLRGRKPEDLYLLPIMNDSYWQTTMRILISIIPAAYTVDPKVYLFIVFVLIKLSIKYGNSSVSALAYAAYGAFLCILNQVEKGYNYGQLGNRILDKFGAKQLKSKLIMTLSLFILPRHDHIDKSISTMREGMEFGLETGDIEYVGYLASLYSYQVFFTGKNLNEISNEMENYASLLKSLAQNVTYEYVCTCLQTVTELITPLIERKITLSGQWFDEKVALPNFIKENNNVGILNIYLCKTILCFLSQEYKEAYDYGKLAISYLSKSVGIFLFPLVYFYHSLACLELCHQSTSSTRRHMLKQVRHNQKKIKKWAKYAPMNYLHKYYLVEAIYAQILGNNAIAKNNFDQAINLARQNRYINDEALANEQAAKFYLQQGREKVAKIYLSDAHYCFKKWGALSKVERLEHQYPTILYSKTSALDSDTVRAAQAHKQFDLEEVMKSFEAIAREIDLEGLLKKMMQVVIETAGAEKGYLLLEKNSNWYIEAEGSINSPDVSVLQNIPIENKLPETIIQQIIKNKKSILIEDASHSDKYSFGSYVLQTQPKSVLCTPLLNQNALSGILYLENNLTVGAFTQDKLDLLNLLSAQIVIAIDNAMSYKYRKELNEAYDRFVPHEFLNFLGKNSIIDVKLGDQVQKMMSIMFCNIDDFANISEKMTPQEAMNFINDYLSHLEPIITRHNGIIDKYINDTVMALFSSADDAVQCGIKILKMLESYNLERGRRNLDPITTSIGINSGLTMLGTVGDKNRMEGTVISDAVNLSSRVKKLTNIYNVSLLITENTYSLLKDQKAYAVRMIDRLLVRGKSVPVTIYEIFDDDPPSQIALKLETLDQFELGVALFQQNQLSKSVEIFQGILYSNAEDLAAAYYIDRCQKLLQ